MKKNISFVMLGLFTLPVMGKDLPPIVFTPLSRTAPQPARPSVNGIELVPIQNIPIDIPDSGSTHGGPDTRPNIPPEAPEVRGAPESTNPLPAKVGTFNLQESPELLKKLQGFFPGDNYCHAKNFDKTKNYLVPKINAGLQAAITAKKQGAFTNIDEVVNSPLGKCVVLGLRSSQVYKSPLAKSSGYFQCPTAQTQLKDLTENTGKFAKPPCVDAKNIALNVIEIENAAKCFGIPALELAPKILLESTFNSNIVSATGAAGIGQLTNDPIAEINQNLKEIKDTVFDKNIKACASVRAQFATPMNEVNSCARMIMPPNPAQSIAYTFAYTYWLKKGFKLSAENIIEGSAWSSFNKKTNTEKVKIEVSRLMYSFGPGKIAAQFKVLLARKVAENLAENIEKYENEIKERNKKQKIRQDLDAIHVEAMQKITEKEYSEANQKISPENLIKSLRETVAAKNKGFSYTQEMENKLEGLKSSKKGNECAATM